MGAKDLIEQAKRAEGDGDLDSALSIWKDLGSSKPDAYFFLQLGRIARDLGRWEEAEDAYLKALEIEPASSLTLELMGVLWAHREDKDYRQSFEMAEGWFRKAAAIEKNAHLLTHLGAVCVELEKNEDAMKAFEEALAFDSRYEEAMYNLAKLRRETQPIEAIRLLQKAIEIDPAYRLAHQELGILLHKQGNLIGAEHHFRRSVEIDPNDYYSMLYLANTLGVEGNEAEAEKAYEEAIALDPDEGSQLFYAKYLDSLGKHERAVKLRDSVSKRR